VRSSGSFSQENLPAPGLVECVETIFSLPASIPSAHLRTGQTGSGSIRPPGTTLFDALVQARDEAGNLLGDDEIEDHIFTMLIAGVDPTPLAPVAWNSATPAQFESRDAFVESAESGEFSLNLFISGNIFACSRRPPLDLCLFGRINRFPATMHAFEQRCNVPQFLAGLGPKLREGRTQDQQFLATSVALPRLAVSAQPTGTEFARNDHSLTVSNSGAAVDLDRADGGTAS
jgi:hypothetical protein